MKAIIKGLEKVDYISKKTGNPVDAVKFHVERKDPNVAGKCTEQIFVPAQTLNNLGIPLPASKFSETLGKTIDVEYNSRGFIADIAIVDVITQDSKKQSA